MNMVSRVEGSNTAVGSGPFKRESSSGRAATSRANGTRTGTVRTSCISRVVSKGAALIVYALQRSSPRNSPNLSLTRPLPGRTSASAKIIGSPTLDISQRGQDKVNLEHKDYSMAQANDMGI